jgi:hypothetical protein
MGDALPNTLLNLNQARANGLIVDDVLHQLGGTHSLYIPKHDLRIPLQFKGVLSTLPIRLPTIEEVENCQWIELTSTEEWDPKSHTLEEQEKACLDADLSPTLPIKDRAIYPVHAMTPIARPFDCPPELLIPICSTTSSSRKPHIDAITLSK